MHAQHVKGTHHKKKTTTKMKHKVTHNTRDNTCSRVSRPLRVDYPHGFAATQAPSQPAQM